jgi:glycosyltransferase involved in cell wall biosynthesis
VLWETFSDFEHLVIGDGCTDDSAEVVASFGDPRIRWHNLDQNSGNQSLPNNTGIALARGQYIAYLGHDDVWYPTHLANLVEAIKRDNADIAYSLCVAIGPPGTQVRSLKGIASETRWSTFTPPSSILHCRSLTDEIGLWTDAHTLVEGPYRDLWERATRARKRFIGVPELTAFKFPSQWRRNSYVEKPSHEQAEYLRRMQEEPDFLYHEMRDIAAAYVRKKTDYSLIAKTGPRRAGWIAEKRREIRGLEPRPLSEMTFQQRLVYWRESLNQHIPPRFRVLKQLKQALRR